MLVVFKEIKQDNVLVFDGEYNEGDLIQFAGILFKKVEPEVFQISKSLNVYVNLENSRMNPFISAFTGITDDFLDQYGISLSEAQTEIEKFLECDGDLLVVSHGLYNDRQTLENNGIDLYKSNFYGYCTYNASKRILKRDKKLSLTDVAAEAGLFVQDGHNAFNDTWATIAVFSLLRKLEEEEKNAKDVL